MGRRQNKKKKREAHEIFKGRERRVLQVFKTRNWPPENGDGIHFPQLQTLLVGGSRKRPEANAVYPTGTSGAAKGRGGNTPHRN